MTRFAIYQVFFSTVHASCSASLTRLGDFSSRAKILRPLADRARFRAVRLTAIAALTVGTLLGVGQVALGAQTEQRTSTKAFEEGRADRQSWESEVAGLSGEFRAGALFWAANRSRGRPSLCHQPQFSANFRRSCQAAKERLDAIDQRRDRDGDYRRGWNATPAPVAPSRPAPVYREWLSRWPSWWIDAALAVLVLGIAGVLLFRWGRRERRSVDPVAGRRMSPSWRVSAGRIRTWLLYWIPTGLIWFGAIALAAACLTALHTANYDVLRLDPKAAVLPVLAIGIWRVTRDGRSPAQRLGILALWAALTFGWIGLAITTWKLGTDAMAAGFAPPHPSRLILLSIVLCGAIRGSAWLQVMILTEWKLNSATGEWHRIVTRGRGHVLLDQRTWEQRRNEELRTRHERRLKLLPNLGVLVLAIIGAGYVWLHFADLPFFWSAGIGIAVFLAANYGLYFVFKPLLLELLYQSGFQHMTGAKVFDRRPNAKAQPFGVPALSGSDEEHSGRRAAM